MFYVCALLSVLYEMSSLNHHCLMFSFTLCLSAATPCFICRNAKSVHKLVLLPPLFESTLLLGSFSFVAGDHCKISLSE